MTIRLNRDECSTILFDSPCMCVCKKRVRIFRLEGGNRRCTQCMCLLDYFFAAMPTCSLCVKINYHAGGLQNYAIIWQPRLTLYPRK